jgi:nucleoside-diphosphate-sugar epimerase
MRVFVTGASGHLGSAVVPELIKAGHCVIGLARSADAERTITSIGAQPCRGDLGDRDAIAAAAAEADGVIHLAFDHQLMYAGQFAAAMAADLAAVQTLGAALSGTGKALVGTTGTLSLATLGLGRTGTEDDNVPSGPRAEATSEVIGLADSNIRSSVIRIPPITHSHLDQRGFLRTLVAIAKDRGVSAYPGDGANRLPAVHTLDVARLYRLALEGAPAGSTLHAVADEAIPVRDIAQHIGRRLGVPTASVPAENVQDHFGPIATMIQFDNPTSSAATQQLLGWTPTHPGALADLESGDYLD